MDTDNQGLPLRDKDDAKTLSNIEKDLERTTAHLARVNGCSIYTILNSMYDYSLNKLASANVTNQSSK